MTYADTSFLGSAYGNDINSVAARQFLAQKPRLPFVFLHWPELAKTFWTHHPEHAESLWEFVQQDIAGGKKLYFEMLDADAVARRAAGLMKHYCPRWKKLRSIDVMHVSAALALHAKTFLSFDSGSFQRVLAVDQGLTVWPPLNAEEKSRLV